MAVLGTVVAINGTTNAVNEVTVVTEKGIKKQLHLNDTIQSGDTIVTPPGVIVELQLVNGKVLPIFAEQTVKFTPEFADAVPPSSGDSAVDQATIQAVIKAINEGRDIGDVLEETAAGIDGGSTTSYGFGFENLLRIVETLNPLAFQFDSRRSEALAIEPEFVEPDQNALPLAAGTGSTPTPGAPSVVVDIVDATLNVADTSSVVTFTFSEAPVGFVLGDITATNGAVTNLLPTGNPLVFTATFTANPGFEGSGSVSVAPGTYTNGAGTPGTGSSDTVGIDTAPPVPTISLDPNITADDIINLAESGQNIPVTGTVGGDAQVGDTVTLTVNGNTYTGLVQAGLTFSILVPGADLAADPDSTIDASVTTTDAAGNSASATDTEGYSVNTGAPSVVVDIVDATLNVADTSSVVTFTFSEAPVGFVLGDITATNGAVTNLLPTGNPLVFTATFTANPGFEGSGSVSVAPGTYTNGAGTPGTGSSDTVGIDTAPPVPTISLDPNITADDIINLAESGQNIPVTGTVGGDAQVGDTVTLTVNGNTYTGLVQAGLTFSILVPGADLAADPDSTIDASVTTTDAAGNSASATDTEGYSVNTGAPSVVVDIVDATLNVADTSSVVTFTFSEAPVGFVLGDITATNGAVTNLLPTGNPLVFTATFTANPGFEGSGSVSVAPGTYTNGAGTPGTGSSDTVGIDTAPPVPTISLDPNITADDIINLAESGQNIPVTGTVGGDAQVGDTVTLTVNGNTYTGLVQAGLTFSILVPGADLAADPDSTIDASVTTTDAAGNSASATDTEGYSVNTGAPSVVVDIVDATLNVADTSSVVTFTFSEAPVGFVLGDITATNGAVTNLLPTGNPLVFTATFTANPGFEGSGSVSVAPGTYTNGAGTPGTGSSDTVGIDTAPPVPTISLDPNITADDIINLAESGQNIPVTGTVGGDAQVGDTVTLTVNGNTYTGLVQAGLTFSILVPGADLAADPDSTIDASVTTTDAAGNSASATDTEGYSVNTGAPSVVVDIVDATLNVADTSSVVTFTFSEAPVGFVLGDITATNGAVTNLLPTGNPLVFTATFTANPGFEGSGSVSVAPGTYTNGAGTPGTGSSDTVGIDTAPPVPTISLDPNITADDIINLAESGQNIPVTGTVGGDAQVGDTVTLTVNGNTYTGLVQAGLTFSILVPGADLAADPDSTIDASVTTTDAAGNSASATDTEGYSVNTGAPSVVVDIVDATLNVADTSSVVTFTFSEAPVGFVLGDITATNGAVTNLLPTGNPLVFTATFTANPGFEGSGSVSVAPGTYTNGAGTPGTGSSDTVGIDTAPPVPTISLDPNITADDIINLAESGQNIPVTGTVGGDAQVGDTVTLTVNGNTYTGLVQAGLTFSILVPGADLAADPDSTIDASVTTTDAAGNSASATDTEGYSVNTGAPSVVVDIVDATLNVADTSSVVTFTFSEAPVGFVLGDITATNGAVTNLLPTGNPLVFTATFTANPGFEGSGSVSVAPGTYTNGAGTPGTGSSDTVGIDTAPPVPTISLDPNITADDIINLAESGQNIPVTGTVGGDAQVGDTVTLTVNGNTYTGLVQAGLTFSILVPGADLAADPDSTIDASVTTTDAAGNSASATDTEGYSVNTGAPSVVVDIVDATLNVADTSSVVTFTFSEAPVGFVLGDITATNGAVTNLLPTGNPLVFTATFTANPGFEGSGSVSVAPGTYTNGAGTPGTGSSDTVGIDTAPPVPTISLDPNITADDIINLAESGQNIPVTGTVGGDAQVGDTVTLTVNGNTYTGLVQAGLTFSILVPGADLAADPDSTIDASVTTTDAAGNSASATDTEGYSVNTGAPSVVVDIVDATLNVADTSSVVTFTFSEAPVGFVLGDITATNGAVTNLLPTGNPLVFTATFTANPGFEGSGSVSVAPGTYTNGAGTPGTGSSDTVGIDTAPPVPTISLDPNITADDIINLAESGQNIPVTGTVGGDAQVGDTVTLTVNGNTYTGLVQAGLTFSILVPGADLAADPDSTIDASVTTTDAAGNSASATDTEGYSVNTGAPSVVVDIVDATLNVADTSSVVTFTFSEAPTGFTAADITAVGGTISGFTATANPLVYTAVYTATPGFTGTGSVSVANNTYTDAAGNNGTGGSDTVPVDTAAPTLTVDIVDTSLNNADTSSVVTFTFSEAPTGFTAADITAVGGTISGFTATANPLVYTAVYTATPGFTGTGSVSVANNTYTDAAGNNGTGGSDTVPVDTAAPTLTVDIVDTSLNNADTSSVVTFTFSEAPTGFTAADITAVGGTISGFTATANPLVYTAVYTATPGFTGTGSVSVANNTYTDAAGNNGTGGSDTVPVDTAAPTLTVDIVDTSLNNADTSSVVTFTFSEAPTGFTAADITAVGGTISGFTATANPLVYTAVYTATPGFTGTGSVSVANNTYTDAAGNNGTGGSDTVPVDTAAPTLTVDIVDTSLNNADTSSVVTFTFSEAPTGFTAADITAVGGTISGFTATANPLVYTAVYTATPGFTGTGSVSVANNTYTDAAGNNGTGGSDTVPVDTAAPTLTVDIVDTSLNNADTSSVVTFTFSEAPTGFTAADITAVGGTISGFTATANPLVYTAVYTATPGFTGTGSVSVANNTYTDAAGNNGTGGSDTVPVDTAAPTLTVDIVDTSLNNADTSSVVTFTFSEAPTGFTAADITAVGGTISGFTATANPLVYTAVYTATPGFTGTGSVSVANNTYTDAAGNNGTGGSDTVPVDTAAPTLTVDIVDTSLNNADTSSVVTFTFSEAPTGFTAADITAVGGTISGFTATANPLVYTAVYTATPGFTGTGSVSVANNTYTDAAGNNGTGGSDTVPVDTAAPTLTVDIVDTSLNNADTSSVVTFTFSEAPTGFTAADITAVGGTISGFTATANPLVYTAVYTATPGFTGTGSVSVANNTYTDAAGNNGTGGSDTVPVDTAAPTLTVDIVDTSLNNADTSSVVTFTFSEAPTGFTAADITAVGGTISGFTATANPLVYTAVYTATPGFTGTGSVSVANNTYTDAAGNNGTGGSDTVPVDTAAPTLTVDIVDTSLNNADTSSVVTFTFSEAPTGFTAADITAVGGTISGFTATANPLVYTAVYTATPGFTGTGSVSVANNTYTDAAGNNGTGGSDTVPVDTAAPTLTVDIVDTSLNNADTSSVVTFTFSEAPTGFTAADITAVGGTISGFTATANPLVYTAVYTATPGFTGTGSVSVANNTYTDAAGNNGTGGSDTVPVDTAAPTLTVDIVDTSLNNADTSSVVTFTFSEAPTGFTAADITAVGGTISGFTATANPLVYTAVYTATPGFTGTGSVSVANNTYTDAAGNNGTGGSDTVPVDTAAPTLTVDIVDTSLNNADTSSVVTFTFSEAPTGFTAADITAVGGTISGFTATANPLVYTAVYTATPGFTGTGSVSVANNTYTDAAGNNGTGGSDTVPVDTAAPTLTVDIVDTSLNNADTSSVVTFTFSEAPTGFTAADITAVGGTISGFTATANPLVYTAVYTATPGFTGTGSVSVANNTYTDAAGNNGTGGSDTVPVDTAAPTLTVDIVDTSLNNADTSSVVTFTFSEAPTGFTAADITAVGGTISGFTATANPLVYTAVYTATPGFTGTGSVSVANNTYTDAAGNNGTGGSDTVPVDTAAPTLTVDIVDTSLNNADTSSVVTFTFSEAPTGFTAADITAVGGTISGFTATANPLVYTAVYTATPGFTGTGSVSVANNTYTDAAGNNGTGGSDTVPVDTAAPTLTVDIVDTSLNNADTSSVVTFTFSEAPTGFTAADITAVGGTISGFTATANPLVYTAVYTATPGFTGTGSVSVANNTYTDAAGNNGTGGSDTVPVDTAAPTLTVDIVDTSLNNADTSSVVTFTFSEAPTGFTAADITAVGGTISGFTATANPLVYTAVYTATPGFTGTGSVSVANNTYTDAAGNNGTGGSDTVPVDTAAPTLTVDIVDTSLNNADTSSVVTFTFSEAPTGFTAADITAVGGTISGFTATANPLVYTAVYTATPGFTGTGSVSVANNTYTDAAGNNGTGGSDTVPVDTAAPTLTVDIVDTSLNNADTSSVVTFTFSEAPTGFTAADITAVGGTISGFTATANPLVYTAVYTATPGFTGTGSVSVANNTYTDAAGNNGTGGSDTVPVDTAAPTLTVDIVDTSLNNADTSSVVTFTFSEAPTGFTAADITAVGGTISGFTATANPLVYTAVYTATPGFTGTGSVSVANNTYTDAAGNNGTGGSDTVPVDTAAPTLTVDIVDTSLNNADTSSVVTFTFSEAPTGFTAADITAVGGTISGFTATANPLVYTAVYTATPGFTGTGSVSVANNTYTDAAGNNGTGGSDTVPVDTAAPSLTVDIVDTSLNNADTSSVVTFTFSEAPTGFTAADITAVGGTISGFTATANPLVYTAVYTATPGFTGTGSVSVANNTYTDAAGNNGTGGSDTVPVDTAAPSLTVDIVDTSLNNADTSSVVTFTFSEAPTGFTAADITAVGGTISGFTATANPLVYTAVYTATPGFTGTGSVSVANNTYTDAAGNNGTGGSDTVPVDTAAPVISAQTFSYAENQVTGATVATVVATDATVYRFTTTGTNTSADGFYQISNAGVITITAAGVASGANNFETAPNSRNYSVTVLDAANNSSAATITLNETNVNETPVASADAYTSVEGTTTLKATVLGNDTDPDGDTLTVGQFATTTSGAGALSANGSNTITTALGGTVVMNANGTYTYTAPARDHSDATADVDTFAYRATDGGLNTAWVTVSITLTDTGPVANNDIDSVGIGSTVAGNVITGAGGITADTLNVDAPHSLTNVTLTAGTQVSNTLGAGNVRTIVTTRGTLVIDQDDGSYTYTASVAPITVTNPTGVASFTAVGVNLYGFDTAEPYNTAGNVNSGLNLANLNATSAARARFQENAGEADDGVGAEQNAGSSNTNRTENGEQLVISLGVASKSTSIVLSNLFTGEVATWETYNAAGAIVSSGTTAGDADGLTNINISSGTAFSYVVVRSTAAASHFRVDGITVIPEPTGVTDVFTYTLRDGDGTTSSATLTMNYDTTTTANADTAMVYESGINANGAQTGGTQEAQTIERATGNLLANDTGVSSFSDLTISGGTITGGTVTASAPDGNGVVTVTVTDTTSGSRAIATITVYTQDFGANVKGDYVVDLVGSTTDGVGTNDSFTMNYTLTNSVSGEVDNSTLTVDVVDDVPTVQNAIVQVQTGTLPDTNLVFVIDRSGSMAGEVKNVAADGTVTIMNRLEATKLAITAVINEYFSQGGNIAIKLVSFEATAVLLNGGAAYTDAASAIAAVNAITLGGGTNYQDGLQKAMDAFTMDGPVNGLENNNIYFISDGVPSVGDTTDPGASVPSGNGYRDFVNANGIRSYAIGIASDISNPTELNNIHNVDSDGSGVKDAAIIVTNVATLDDVLLASVPTSFGGSVAGSTATSSLNFGADGGYISSLVMRLDTNGDNVPDADVTFNYNPTTGQITVVGGGTPQTGFPLTSDTLTLNNANGFENGILIFNFTTGEYTYQTAGFATEGEQFDINFVATDGDGDTASGKQTIQIVDGKPEANNDVDTLMGNATFFEGNVISAIGTDGGDSLQLTSFSTGRSGEDNPGDGGSVSSIVFKGITFDLTAVVGSTAALGGTYTVTTVGGVNTLTWTHATNGSSLVFNEEGYYRYAPPTAELSTNVTGASTNYTLTSGALVTTAATAGMTLTGIARTSAAEGSAAINTPNADGVGIVGNTDTRIDSLESLVITFDTSTHPHGVQGVTITVDTSNSNLGGTNAFNYNVYNVHGELIGQFASNLEGNVVLPAGLTGIGKIVIDAGGVGSYPGAFGSISAVRYSTILDTAGTPAPAAEVIGYTITDTDGDTSSATLTLNNIIDDIAGTSANNTINGTGRNENISGFAGDDTINAGAGYDIVRGGDGNDTIDGGADDDQLYGNAGNDTITGGTGKDQIYGDDGNDTLSGNDGDDYIDGGAGNDIINGGLGADIIMGGAGNDTLTGGSVGVVDTFRWELADRGTTSAPATDTITDFDPLAAGAGGDVLDLRDLLTGESHVGVTPGNLSSYLHFEVVGGNTIIHISNNGGYSNGYAPTKDVQRITLTGVDLVQSFTDDDAVIQNLLTNNKLIVD